MLRRASEDFAGSVRGFLIASPKSSAALAVCIGLAVVLAAHFILALAGQNSGAWILRDLAAGQVPESGDSWDVMLVALDWLDAHPNSDGSLYSDVFFDELNKFQYAPTSLLPLDLLRLLGFEITPLLLNNLNRIILLVTALGAGVLCWLLPARLAIEPHDADTRRARLILALAAPGAALMFFPLLYGYHLGQLQIWINALFTAACIAWLTGHRGGAGLLIGLVCLLKPQFGLFLLWGALRREWRFTAALAATGAAGLILSVLLYGFGNHLGYLEVLSYLSRHGESYWANQSANGLLQRIFQNGDIHDFGIDTFPPFHPIVYGISLVVTVLLLAGVFRLRRADGQSVAFFDFQLAALAFTAASPIAWEHHYGIMVPIFGTLATVWILTSACKGTVARGLYVFFAFLVAALPFWAVHAVSGIFHLMLSYLYFSALFVLAALWALVNGRWGTADTAYSA